MGCADVGIGLFQFDSVDGPAVDGVAAGVLAVASVDGVSTTPGSGARLGTGAGAAGGGSGGAGVGRPGLDGAGGGFGSGFRWTSGSA